MTRSRAPAGAVRAVPAGWAKALRGALVALSLSGLVVGLVAHALGQAVAATPACSLASSADGQGAAAAVRVAIDGRPAAILSFTDPLRCDGADTLAALPACGIARIVLATGTVAPSRRRSPPACRSTRSRPTSTRRTRPGSFARNGGPGR